ncbi:hypothetical protein B0A55_00711 [Friedmanniomyces simplex]|uniref:Uncharacterized protein n=1 Tax=Friedmanniomyces simplex TaxID=329884 RepID=A0A4U0Y6C3_9PEZI|nr:hypothetical protein B0A55_00711 [Friedmanniomyces simplex]
MCTQKLIWCSCGHGEFLPIEKCSRAVKLGYCWTVIWGDSEEAVGECEAEGNGGKVDRGGGGGGGSDWYDGKRSCIGCRGRRGTADF